MLDNAVTMRPGAAAGKLQDSEDNVRRIRGHGAHMGTWVGAGVSPRSELCHDGWSPYMSLHLKWDPFSLHIKLDPVASVSTFICTFFKNGNNWQKKSNFLYKIHGTVEMYIPGPVCRKGSVN